VPFAQITQASTTTQRELGVVAWWTIQNPNGNMALAGVDASQAIRVEFIVGAVKTELRTPNGTFDIISDGNTVRSNTIAGNAGALRTLELLKADLAQSRTTAAGTVNASSVGVGQLHPTDTPTGCQKGAMVESCPSLFSGDCSEIDYHVCQVLSGNLSLDAAQAASQGKTFDPKNDYYYNSLYSPNYRCYESKCLTQWHIGLSDLLNCQDRETLYNGNRAFCEITQKW
jgi:hypothetical protein